MSRETSERMKVFIRPKELNTAFYEYFQNKFRLAKRRIYITGEGFSFSSDQEAEIARNFVIAMRDALANPDLKIVRVQTDRILHPEWAKLMMGLICDFKNRFRFFLLNECTPLSRANLCAIDPDHPEDSVVEIMLSLEQGGKGKKSETTGNAFFIEGNSRLASKIRQSILDLANHSIEIESAEEIYQLYFAYGLNMGKDMMKERCPSSEKVGVGVLTNYGLVFNHRGVYRPGGLPMY